MTLMAKPDYIESMAGRIAEVMVGLDILTASALGAKGCLDKFPERQGSSDFNPCPPSRRIFSQSSFANGSNFIRIRKAPRSFGLFPLGASSSVIFLHCLLGVILILVLPFLLVLLNEFGMLGCPSLIVLEGLLFVRVVILLLLLKSPFLIGEIPFSTAFLGARFFNFRVQFSHWLEDGHCIKDVNQQT